MNNTQQYNKEQDINEKINDLIVEEVPTNMITQSDTETTVTASLNKQEKEEIKQPEKVVLRHNMQCLSSSDNIRRAATIKRQPSSMSNIGLLVHEKIPPRILTKDASYSFIWIDDHFSDDHFSDEQGNKLSCTATSSHDLLLKEEKKSKLLLFRPTTRGFCNLFTIVFIILIILFLFLYPFITLYFIH